jgi:hypothetical protein
LALPHPDIEEFVQFAQMLVDFEEKYYDLAHTCHDFLQQSDPSFNSAVIPVMWRRVESIL